MKTRQKTNSVIPKDTITLLDISHGELKGLQRVRKYTKKCLKYCCKEGAYPVSFCLTILTILFGYFLLAINTPSLNQSLSQTVLITILSQHMAIIS